MCDKSVNKCSLAFIYFPDQYKTQEMYDRDVSKDTFSKFHRPDRYRTERMCDEAVNDCPTALENIPD